MTVQVRTAIYSADYLDPLDKKELPPDVKDLGERVYMPIKAMKSSQTISHSYDPVLE